MSDTIDLASVMPLLEALDKPHWLHVQVRLDDRRENLTTEVSFDFEGNRYEAKFSMQSSDLVNWPTVAYRCVQDAMREMELLKTRFANERIMRGELCLE